jgi:TorA maturation chaperone TorD
MSETRAATEATQPPLAAEDQARANFYALLARLYATAPDEALLATIAAADELPVVATDAAARDLARSWQLLTAASRAMNAGAIEEEFQDLFVGVGKSEVSLHASGYLKSTGGSVLADLRTTLARLGLGRKEGVSLYEDHLATVCETMRVLIGGAPGIEPCTLAQQREFFAVYVLPWVVLCCNAIKISPIANYYRQVAEFTECFMAIERDSFAIE